MSLYAMHCLVICNIDSVHLKRYSFSNNDNKKKYLDIIVEIILILQQSLSKSLF